MGFLNGVCGGEFYVANLSAPKPHFRHTGRLDEELSRWIKTRLVSNPTCLLASSVDVFLIFDSKMHYSVLGAPPEIIEKFEKRFGGAEALQNTFTNFVAQLRIGSGMEEMPGWFQQSRDRRRSRGDRVMLRISMDKVFSWDFGQTREHYARAAARAER